MEQKTTLAPITSLSRPSFVLVRLPIFAFTSQIAFPLLLPTHYPRNGVQMCIQSPTDIPAARVPKITDLRNRLNYGDARLERCTAFTDDLRVFRRRYSVSGIRGSDLWDWKSSNHQDALRKMTTSFLEGDGYGETYWPSDPAARNFNLLRYSADSIL